MKRALFFKSIYTLRTLNGACAVLLTAGALSACGPGPGQDVEQLDAIINTDRPNRDVPSTTDAMSADGDAAQDVPGLDVPTEEGGMFDVPNPPADGAVVAGRCTTVGARQTLTQEQRLLSRQVYVSASPTAFYASTARQNMGVDQINFFRFSPMGAMMGVSDVLPDHAGSVIRGGGFAPTAAGFTVAANSNMVMGAEIYAQRLDSNGMRMGSPIRITQDPEISELPQVARTAMGEVIVWRSTNDMIGDTHLFSSRLAGGMPTAPVNISGMGVQVGSFDMSSDGTHTAVAFVSRSNSNGDVVLLALNANGTVARTIALTMGAHVSESVSVSVLGTDAVVAWTERRADGTLRARRANLDTGVMGPEVVVPEVGLEISQVGIAPDANGVVAVFRALNMMGGSIAIARLGPTLALREGVSRVGAGSAGDAIRVIAKGDGTFGVGWADETMMPMSTTTYFQVMQCP